MKTKYLKKGLFGSFLAVMMVLTHCVTWVPVSAAAGDTIDVGAEPSTRIFFEETSEISEGFEIATEYTPSKLFTVSSLVDGHNAMSACDFAMSEDKDLVFTTNIDVETAGTYLIKTIGSLTAADSAKHTWLTACTVMVDEKKLSTNPVFSEEFVSQVTNSYYSAFTNHTSVLTSQAVYLTEGTHTITHNMGGRGGTRDIYAFTLDFMDIVQVGTVDGEQTTVIPAYYLNPTNGLGASMVIPDYKLTTDLGNNKKIEEKLTAVHIHNGGVADYSVSIDVKADGLYDVSFLVSPNDATWKSTAKMWVDGDETSAVVVQSLSKETLNYGWTGTETGYTHNDFQPNRYTTQIFLTEGRHTLDIHVENMVNGHPIFTFDRIEIAPSKNGLNTESCVRLEAENAASEWEMVSDTNVSGEAVLWLSAAEAKTIEFTFPVVEAGYYNLNLCASNSESNDFLSLMDYQIDAEEPGRVGKETLRLSVPQEQQAKDDRLAVFTLALFRCGDAHYFTKGLHTVTITPALNVNNPSGYYATVDYIELRPQVSFDGLRLEVENGYAAVGETAEVRVLNDEGKEIMREDTFSDIKYVLAEESEEDVAELSGNILTGINYGKGIAEALLMIENQSYDLKADFYVTDTDGLVLNNATVTGNQLKINVCAMKAGTPAAKLFAYVYGQSNGMLRSIKDVYQISLPEFGKAETKELVQTISMDSTDAIGVILMNADNEFAAYRQLMIR